jgi:hypothetical protein
VFGYSTGQPCANNNSRYAASRANARSVPISDTLTGLVTALPIVSGLLLESGYDFTRRQERRQQLGRGEIQRPPLVIIANTLIFIYSSVAITLAGTHAAPPSGLDCGLRERWQTLFRQKNADAIQKIQDAFKCCGFANSHDMAWPFPDKTHNQHACETAFGRNNACLAPWKAEEQQIAGLLMAVVGMVFLWQFAIIVIPTQKESWLHRIAPDRLSRMIADERHGGSEEPRRAIGYVHGYNRYSDRVEEEEDDDHQRIPERAIEEGNRRLNSVLPGQLERDQQPFVDNEWARTGA